MKAASAAFIFHTQKKAGGSEKETARSHHIPLVPNPPADLNLLVFFLAPMACCPTSPLFSRALDVTVKK